MATVRYTFASVTGNFRVNSIRAGDQTNSDVTAILSAKGGFYVAFNSTNGSQVDGRIFNEDASARTGEFRVSTGNVGNQLNPSITSLPNGSLITLFESRSSGGSDISSSSVRGRLLDSEGRGNPDFLVAQWRDGAFNPSVAATNDGFVASWFESAAETALIANQRYNSAGTKVGGSIYGSNDSGLGGIEVVHTHSAAGLANGGFVTVVGTNEVSTSTRYFFQRLTSNGRALKPTLIEQAPESNPPVPADIKIVGLSDGGFLVAYVSNDNIGNGKDIIVRVYNANGTPRTERLWIGADDLARNGSGTAGDQDQPELAILSNGAIAVSWTSRAEASTNIEARVLTRDGAALTGVVNIAAHAIRGESDSALAGLLNGRLVATWTVDNEGNGLGTGIQGRQFELSRLVTGDDTNETLAGDSLRDKIDGRGGNDLLNGRDGSDTLDGGTGADRMTGGLGNDLFLVDRKTDLVIEVTGQGRDTVWSSVSFSLASRGANVEVLRLTGGADTNGTGNALDNRIYGNRGDNILNGAAGQDVITGAAGDDTFRFTKALIPSNIDRVLDFTVADDTFSLENTVFQGLATGRLAASAFRTGASAADTNDRIIYNPVNGTLWFDRDGTGPVAQLQFAIVGSNLALTTDDFWVT